MIAGATSQMRNIFILDSSSTVGAGLTGLVFNSASLTAHYIREGEATVTAITLVTAVVGTFTSSGFIEVDATNMPGIYQIGIPDAAIATGVDFADIHLKGAANMAPVTLHLELGGMNVVEVGGKDATAIPELAQAQPSATPNLLDAIMFLYMRRRNLQEATEKLESVYDNAGTKIAKADLADDGTTTSKKKYVSGA